MDVHFCHGETKEPVYNIILSNNPLLKAHSNKEHDNVKLHPPNTESIEQLIERMIHSVPV